MHSRNHQPRRHTVPVPPTTTNAAATILILLLRHPERRVALENPLVNEEQRLLRRREGRHSPLGVAAARVGNLDDTLLVAGDQLVHVDPRAGVLPYGLNDASGLPDHAAGLHVVTQNAVTGGHRYRRFLLLRLEVASSAAATVAVAIVVVISRSGPS